VRYGKETVKYAGEDNREREKRCSQQNAKTSTSIDRRNEYEEKRVKEDTYLKENVQIDVDI